MCNSLIPRCPECNREMVSIIIFQCEETGDLLQKFYCEECDESALIPCSNDVI